MIKDARHCDPASLLGHTHCIVGAGPVGISLAKALADKGHRVLLLEAGGPEEEADLTAAYEGQAHKPHAPTTEYRRQRLGGTSHLWGGRCVPLDPHDYAHRSHVPDSGWPLEEAELSPYLEQASALCDAGQANFTVSALRNGHEAMFDGLAALAPDLHERIERYSLPTDFGHKFRHELQQSSLITVLLHARVTDLHLQQDGSLVQSVEVAAGLNGRRFRVVAGQFILCGGGIETTRLMLVARRKTPAWARFDGVLGHYYACHVDANLGELRVRGRLPHFDFETTVDGVYARRKLQFSADFQARHGLLNSTFRLHFPAYADASHGSAVLSAIYLAKSVLPREHQTILNHGRGMVTASPMPAHALNVVRSPWSIASFGWQWLWRMKLARRRLPYTLIANRNGSYPLEFNSEQVPSAQNRISLLDRTDPWGMPQVAVHWQLTPTDVASGIRSFELLRNMLSASGAGQLSFDPGQLREHMQAAMPIGGHHMGSTRMGEQPGQSVVNRHLQVHGVHNLYLCSSSVFPTNGHANPTLATIALALRLAQRW